MPRNLSALTWDPTLDKAAGSRRADGSEKGMGFLGPLKRPDGGVSTELSMGTADVDGTETEIPLLVPTLDANEVRYLLSAPDGDWQHPTMQRIAEKAIAFARQRKAQGQPYFAGYTEQNTRVVPELERYAYPDRPVPSHRSLGALGQR
jgi:hypothetical protein